LYLICDSTVIALLTVMAISVIIYQTIKRFMFEVESLALIHIVNKKKLANT